MSDALRYLYAPKNMTADEVLDKINEAFSDWAGVDKAFYLTTQGAYAGYTEADPENKTLATTAEELEREAVLYSLVLMPVGQTN